MKPHGKSKSKPRVEGKKKPRVRILLPVWGADYIKSFQEYGLRTLLAPGNIPAMARRCDTEFVFLTPGRDHALLTESPFYEKLKAVCQVTFVEIDDLLLDNMLYGYTLTYAYHRGILTAGDRLKDTHFVFIVGDYVFSENSFDSLSRLIVAGHRVILSGSLRVDRDGIRPLLRGIAKKKNPLIIPPRQAVEFSLRHLHPSLEAKIVNRPPGSGGYSSNFQHFYWRAYPKTLISRNFMTHMLCINPESCPPHPRGFCDYTFIPDLAPGAAYAWLDDSDDYFAMELQDPDHEKHFTQKADRSTCRPQDVAHSLSLWTTDQHRGMADHTFIYHAGPIPEALHKVEAEAAGFVAQVKSHLAEPPVSHLNHPHWEKICEMIVEGTQRRWRQRAIESQSSDDVKPRKFNFAMSVWGMRYVDILLKVGLPSQLSPGNLQSFPWLDSSIYEFYTTRHDAGYIRGSALYRWLCAHIEVRFIYIDDVLKEKLNEGKWGNVRYCHREAVKSADAREAAVFFLCPDQVWPDGSLVNAGKLIDAGYSAVMCPGPRAIEETMVPLLRERYLSSNGLSLTVSARDLVKAGLEHVHREMREWTWDAPEYFGYPTYVMFDVPGQGVLAHCYILHPVVINAEVRNAPFEHVFDQDYLMNACPDVSKIYVSGDSDEVFHFELSPSTTTLPEPARLVNRRDPEVELMWYGEKQFNAHHRSFAKKPIRIHYSDIEDASWRSIEERALGIINRIDRGWNIPDSVLVHQHPDHLIRRMEKRYPDWLGEVLPKDKELWDEAKDLVARGLPSNDGEVSMAKTPMAHIANQWILSPGPPGSLASLFVGGPDSDKNAGAVIGTKGSGSIYFNGYGVSTQFGITPTPGAVNHLAVTGSAGTSPPTLFPQGSAHRLGMLLASKNGGAIHIGGTSCETAAMTVEPGAVTIRGHVVQTAADGLVARGRDRHTALRLKTAINYVISGEANSGVILPDGRTGLSVVVINGSDEKIIVYATGFADIDTTSGAAGRAMWSGDCVEFICVRENDWVSIQLGSMVTRRGQWRSFAHRAIEIAGKFDRDFYLRANPDVMEAGVDPETHYHEYGWKEGRDPSPYFNTKGYLAANPDVVKAGMDPLDHFVRYGAAEDRQGWQKPFDENLYREHSPFVTDGVDLSGQAAIEASHAAGNGYGSSKPAESWLMSLINRLRGTRSHGSLRITKVRL